MTMIRGILPGMILHRGTTAENAAFTGLLSEVTVDTDLWSLRVHDGETVGGFQVTPTLSVKLFGAKGDGVTDDTEAIQAAMAYAVSVSGATILFPRGVYPCTEQIDLPANTLLIGEGRILSYMQFSHTGAGVKSTSPVNSSTAVRSGMRHIGIVGTNGSNTDGGFVDVCGTYINLYDVYVQGFKHCIIFDQTEISSIINCELLITNTSGLNGIWLVNGDGDYAAATSQGFTNVITISGNQINSNNTTGVSSILDDGGSNHVIVGNNCNAGAVAIRMAGVSGIVQGNTCEGQLTSDILLRSSKASGTYVGPCTGLTLSANALSSNGCTQNIQVTDAVNCLITGNVMAQAVTACINFDGGTNNQSSGVVIEGNAKSVRGSGKTAAPFIAGNAAVLAVQKSRQVAQTYVSLGLSAGARTVTPQSMEGISATNTITCQNADGTNFERVVVSAVTATTFDATFASDKAVNWVIGGTAYI